MQEIKDVLEATSARLKNPIIGSSILFSLLINWKSVFFVIFSADSVNDRFAYFENSTTILSLFVFPIILGIIYSAVSPWISLAGTYLASNPETRSRLMQVQADQKVIERRSELEERVAEIQRNREAELLDRAKRDDILPSEISDPELLRRTQDELSKLRSRFEKEISSGSDGKR